MSDPASPSPEPTPPPDNDDALIGGWRVGVEIGDGPLGRVFFAAHAATGASAAFRVFAPPAGGGGREWVAVKLRLAETLERYRAAAAGCDRVAQILGYGEDDDLFWVAAEYVPGVTLADALRGSGPRGLSWSLSALEQIGAAVDHLGTRGLPHGDLTPYTVRVAADGPDGPTIKVADLGLSAGRPRYGSRFAAPEQQAGYAGGWAADVWASGCLFYEMLSGRPVFDGASLDDLVKRINQGRPEPLRDQPAYVQGIVSAMLYRDPEHRYPSVGAAVADLRARRDPTGTDIPRDPLAATPAVVPPLLVAAPLPGIPPPLFPPAPVVADVAPPSSPADPDAAFRDTRPPLPPSRFDTPGVGDTKLDGDAPLLPHAPVPHYEPPTVGADADTSVPANALVIDAPAEMTPEREARMLSGWRASKRHEKAVAGFEERRAKRGRWARVGVAAAAVAGLVAHANGMVGGYRTVTVLGAAGKPTVTVDGKTSALTVGQSLSVPAEGGGPILSCGASDRVLLDMRGARLHLPEGASLEIKQLDYRGGPVRRFAVRRGRVVAWVDPNRRGGAVFELAAGAVRAVARGTLFSVGVAKSGAATVSVREGTVRVARYGTRAMVGAGKQVVAPTNGKDDAALPEPGKASAAAREQFTKSLKALTGVGGGPGDLATTLAVSEERLLMPVAETGSILLNLPTYLSDRRAVLLGVGSMQALVTVMQASEDAPARLKLTDIADLGVKQADQSRILGAFADGRLVSFRRLPGGGYELLAKAKDGRGTLIRGHDGRAYALGNDDTE